MYCYTQYCWRDAAGKEKQFAGINDMLIALDHGQIDAFVHAQESLKAALEEKPDQYRMLEEPIGETECGMAVSPKTRYPQLADQLNTFLAELKASGRGSSHPWRRR